MPTISGYVRDAKVTTATNAKGKTVDVSKKTAEELVKKLGKGRLFISLGDFLYENKDAEIELVDFEESP